MVDAFLGKKYKLYNSENFDEFMKALEVGYMTRKASSLTFPIICLTKEGGRYIFTSQSSFKTIMTKFTPGVEFDDVTPDGRSVKNLITIQGNVLTEVHKDENGNVSTFERIFSANEVKMTCKVDRVVCTRIYRQVD